MKTIAVISKNKCTFDRMEEFALPLLYRKLSGDERKEIKTKLNNYIWEVIGPYVKFITIQPGDATGLVSPLIECFENKNPDDFFYHTESSYSFPKKYFELVNCQPVWSDYKMNEISNMNDIGCYFSLKHTVIENNCIILANEYDLDHKPYVTLSNVTRDDLIRVIRRRFFHSAVLIKENETIKYYYQNPSYLIQHVYGLDASDSIEKLPFTLLKYNLVFYFRQDKNTYVNEIGTRLNGMYRVYGDILVFHEMEEGIYANLNVKEVERLNVLSYGPLANRNETPDEEHRIDVIKPTEDKSGGEWVKETPLWSRYLVTTKRLRGIDSSSYAMCANCNSTIDAEPLVCSQCFRVKYCSLECEEKFNCNHKTECIKESFKPQTSSTF